MFKVSILSRYTQAALLEGETSRATVPGEGGELTLLPFHFPIIIRLKTGYIRLDNKSLYVKDGILRFIENKLYGIVE